MSKTKKLVIILGFLSLSIGVWILPEGIGLQSNAINTPTIQIGARELIMNNFDSSGPSYDMSSPTLRHPTQRDKIYTWWVNATSFKQFLGTVDNPFQTQTPGYTYSNNWNRNGFPREPRLNEITFGHRPWMANVYKHTDGTLIGFVHIETDQYDRPDPLNPGQRIINDYVRYRQGISISTDGGVRWTYLGDVIRPQRKDGFSNLGGTPLLIVPVQENGQEVKYFYQYFNEVPLTGPRIPAVARARVNDVVAAAKAGTVSTWTKYNRNTGGWTESGLDGLASNITWNIDNQTGLNASNPTYPDRYDMHTDAVYSTALGKYILVAWEQAGWDYYPPYNKSQSNKGIYIYTSTDGINWGDRKKIYTPLLNNEENPYMFFAGGMDHPDTSEDFNIIGGNSFYLYFPDRINHKFYRIPITITGGSTIINNTLSVSKNGQGTITSNTPGINCGTDCSESYPSTSSLTITLSATATNGHVFTGWSGACTGTGACSVVMNGNKNVVANFSPIAIKIMPLGDSITQANGPVIGHPGFPGGYRKKLGELLTASGINYDFVGASTDNPAPGIDPDHNGYPGYRTDEILSRLPNWLSTSDPDVVLLHIGTNDLLQHRSTSSAINNLRQIVRQIVSDTSREVYIAKIIPILDSWENLSDHPEYNTPAYWKPIVDGYNQAIIDMLSEVEFKDNTRIHIVDMTGSVTDPSTGETCAIMLCETFDGLHPAQKGLNRMGILWHAALTGNDNPEIVSPIPTITSPTANQIFPGNTSTINLEWGAVSNASGYLLRVIEFTDATRTTQTSRRYAGNTNNSSFYVYIDNHSSTSLTGLPVDPGRHYRFWIHSVIDGVTSEGREVFFSVNPSTVVTPKILTTTLEGQGLVNAIQGGINCGADCSESYSANESITLNATPDTGHTFTGWSGACTGTGSCTVTMTQNRTVTATFVPITYTLTTTTIGEGTIGGNTSAVYNSGTSVTITAYPGVGYSFTGWSGACTSSSPACTVTMNSNKTATATFTAIPTPRICKPWN